MKLSDITLLASCAALALAHPLEKRVLVIETVYEQVVQTVEVISTYYVQPGEQAPSSSVAPEVVAVVSSYSKRKHGSKNTSKPPPIATSPPEVPPPVVSPPPPVASSAPPPPPPPPVASSAPPPPPPPPVVSSAPPPPPPPPVVSSAPPPPPPVVSSAPPPPPPPPVVTPPPPVPSPSAAPQQQYEYSYSVDNQAPAPSVTPSVEIPRAPAGGSGGGACGEIGGKCSGDLTFYDAGLGACGFYNDGNTEAVFALAHGMMGEQSNGNPFCGRTATVTANGKSVICKLVDKCMGCEGQSIDLSNFAIDQIMDRSVGRMHDVQWYFND